MRRVAKSYKLFDLMYVHEAGIYVNHLNGLVNELKYFGSQHFSNNLLILLNREIPILV